MQTIIFLALLFYMLAAENDPLKTLADLLPLSPATKQRARVAFSNSMRGVFIAAVKLSAFHALFTWLSLTLANVHLVYMSTVASAVVPTPCFYRFSVVKADAVQASLCIPNVTC